MKPNRTGSPTGGMQRGGPSLLASVELPRTVVVMFDLDAEYEAAARFTREWLIAPSTRRSYERAFSRFRIYCAEHGKESLPASAGTVVEWVEAIDSGSRRRALARQSRGDGPWGDSAVPPRGRSSQPNQRRARSSGVRSARGLRPPIQKARPLKPNHLIDVVHHHGNSPESDALVIGYFGALRAGTSGHRSGARLV